MLSPYPHIWFTPPLPFAGNKRWWRKEVLKILRVADMPIIVDLFGGSGLLARWAKDMRPVSTVIWNDFDNYADRLKQIDITNRFIEKYREYALSVGVRYNKFRYIKEGTGHEERQVLMGLLKEYRNEGGTDDVTLRSFLTLHGRNGHFPLERLVSTESFYMRHNTPHAYDSTYLAGIERTSCDWEVLADKYSGKAFFIADPPYSNTETYHYSGSGINHTKLANFLSNEKFMFFTNENSNASLPTYEGKVDKKTTPFKVSIIETMLYKV